MKCPKCNSNDYYFGLCGPNCINQNCSNFKGSLNKINESTYIEQGGYKEWRQNELLHREDGPAIEYPNGDKLWCQNGKCHREDGPAEEWIDGTKFWWKNGKRHREDGPAIEWPNGSKSWWKNGKRHREGGPAVEYSDGHKEYWIEDKQLTEEEFNQEFRIEDHLSNYYNPT